VSGNRILVGCAVVAVAVLPAFVETAAADDLPGPAYAATPEGGFVALDVHASLLSDLADRSFLSATFGYGARGGYRWSGWAVFLQVEHNLWAATEQKQGVVQGAVNIGVGCELIYADGFVHTSLALGPSILAFDTVLDDAGTTGIFLDVRPVGLRWPVHDNLLIVLEPITFALVAPVLGGIPLIYAQYRTVLSLEAVF
jgi:hypothetical protein